MFLQSNGFIVNNWICEWQLMIPWIGRKKFLCKFKCRILNFKIFEGSMFFYEVSWFDDRKPCYLPCFTVGTTMMPLCLRQTVPIHSTTADRSLYRWVFLLTSQRDRWEGDFRKIEMCQSFFSKLFKYFSPFSLEAVNLSADRCLRCQTRRRIV